MELVGCFAIPTTRWTCLSTTLDVQWLQAGGVGVGYFWWYNFLEWQNVLRIAFRRNVNTRAGLNDLMTWHRLLLLVHTRSTD